MRSSGVPIGYSFGSPAAQQWNPDLRLEPYLAFDFAIEIEGLLVGGFAEVSGLESQIETEEYREGGVNGFVHHLPRQAAYGNLVLQHGLTDLSGLWGWYYNVAQGVIERKNGTIMLLDTRKLPVMWWNFFHAYPVRWTGPQFNAQSGEVAFESVELVHEGFTRPMLSQAATLGRGAGRLAGVEEL